MPYIANPLEGLPIRNSFITDQASLGEAAASDDTVVIYDISATALKQLTIANLQAGILASPAFTGNPTAPTQSAGNNTTRLATTAFVTTATNALNTVGEMTDVTITSIASGEVLKWNGSAWVNNTLAEANILTVAGPTFTGVLTVGSAVISEADLEQIDDLTAGTAVASKALVVDSNKDIGTIRNLTIDGVFTDGNYTFATDGSVTGLGAITSTGVVTATGFTIGSAVIAEAELEMIDGITAGTAAASKALVLDSSSNIASIGTISSGAITSSGVVTGTGFTIGSAVIVESELEMIDGITAGTALASKALVVDSNKDIGTIRNLTIDGTFSDGNYTFATDGSVTGLGSVTSTGVITGTTIEATADTSAGDNAAMGYTSTNGLILTGQGYSNDVIIKNDDDTTVMAIPTGTTGVVFSGTVEGTTITATTAFVPDASDGAALGTSALEFSDLFLADGAVLSLGDHQDVTFTHVHNTGVLLNSSSKIQFGDTGTFIHQSSNGTLTIESDSTVDINGAVAFDGALTGITDITLSGALSDGNYTFATDGSVTGLGTVASGTHTIGSLVVAAASITDTSGDITFGNENLSTTGTLAAGTTTIGSLVVAAASITDTSGAISFGDENLTTTGVVTAGGITLGSAVLIEAELEMLDGITAGTAAASKALVLDGSKNIATIGTIGSAAITSSGTVTATGFIIGSANIAEAELEMIDGITAGTAAASKALVLDSSTNITGIGTISAGAITSSGVVTGTAFTAGSAVLAEAELELLDGLTAGTAIASKVVTTDASIDTTGQRNLTITGELDAATGDFSSNVDIAGTLTMSGNTLDMSSEDIDNIRSATFIAEVDNGNSSTSDTVDWGAGQKQKSTLTGNCTFTFTAPDGPCNVMFKLIQDGTGSRTVTWPNTVKWPAATAPTLTTSANGVDIVAFYYDGTNYYAQATLAFG